MAPVQRPNFRGPPPAERRVGPSNPQPEISPLADFPASLEPCRHRSSHRRSTHSAAEFAADRQREARNHTGGNEQSDDPSDRRLAARGLKLIEDLGAAEYRSRYLGTRRGALRSCEFYRAAVARVAPSADAA